MKLQSFSGFKCTNVYVQGGDKVWSISQNHLIVEFFFFFSMENTLRNDALSGSYVILILPRGKVKPFNLCSPLACGPHCQLLLITMSPM